MQSPKVSIKWKASDYKYPFQHWTPPELIYPCQPTEKDALHALKNLFQPLPPYQELEPLAKEQNTQVTLDTCLADGHIAFLENTAEQCTSPQTKHSQDGMQGARHWVQRVDTPEAMFQRLTDGYGISLMFGERCHQYIRNSNNWRGINGVQLDLDVWYQQPDALKKKLEAEDRDADFIAERLDANEKLPLPVYSESELFDRYPLLPRICAYLLPSASSLYEGKPFNARGIIPFPEPITDMRIYRAFGDILCSELDCIPANVTKNPVAVGFGNTHNAPQAYRNERIDTAWISDRLQECAVTVIHDTQRSEKKKKEKTERKAHYASQSFNGTSDGENISAFIETCDPVAEMVKDGLLTPGKGNDYQWHQSENARSCDILDGVIHIFSHTMSTASPAPVLEPVGAHRFYLHQLCGLDMTQDADKPRIREYLFEHGYGSDPKAFISKRNRAKLQHTDTPPETTETHEENSRDRDAATDRFLSSDPPENLIQIQLVEDDTGSGKTYTSIKKAKQHGKKVLALTEHNKLAEQAIEIASNLGFENTLHLKGREHNWDASGIAEIPIAERTAALFDSNICILCEPVREYIKKNLAAMTFCMLFCPFRTDEQGNIICKYIQQYEGIEERDFIVTSNLSLLFDPSMHPHLTTLVNAKNEPTDEDLAIDAMLGTTSEETQSFALVDDYQLSMLYPEKAFSQDRFKSVQKAWSGTPTAKFASLMLKAFEKKKPQKIVKALRNALESTTEHHDEISKHLAQHARRGIVEHTSPPKGSKETQNLLSEKHVCYDDGGKQFIPVNITAYLELKEKDVPVIHPSTLASDVDIGKVVIIPHAPSVALQANISLKDLTPVWQKGVTPIELLKMFLSQIGNPKNAPIKREFTGGEKKNNAVLTFSIPPQAPVSILTHIAMLSATVDPADTRKAFGGQPVAFSDYTGGSIKYADGVETFQYQEARLTSGSVFEYPTDIEGKRQLQEPPTGLKATAKKRLTKLNDWAKNTDGLTAFISYKGFTEAPFGEAVDGFDIVTHFDKVTGLNFKGLKLLVIFGCPKVKHEVLMWHAHKQYAPDNDPLPKADPTLLDDKGKPIPEYIQLTEETESVENGISIIERRYKDPRLEKIRHQLSTKKLKQALGRARFIRWEDTTTLLITNTPVKGFTERANLFSDAALNLAETPSELPAAMDRIKSAEETGDVQAVMETKAIGKSQAYEVTKETRQQEKADRDAQVLALHQQGKNKSEIHRETDVPRKTVSDIISRYEQGGENSSPLLVYTYRTSENPPPPENTDTQCLDSEPLHTQEPSVDPQKADRNAQIIALHQQGGSLRKIHAEIGESLGISYGTIAGVVKAYKNSDPLLVYTYRQSEKLYTPENTDTTCVDSETLHTQEPSVNPQASVPPIPDTDYSRLDLDTAKQELVRCQERNNYNGAAFLRKLIKNKERQQANTPTGKGTPTDVPTSKRNSMDYYKILTIPGVELFAKIGEINDIANDDTSPERDVAIDALNNLSSLLRKRYGSSDEVLVAPGKLLTFSTVPDSLIDSLPEK